MFAVSMLSAGCIQITFNPEDTPPPSAVAAIPTATAPSSSRPPSKSPVPPDASSSPTLRPSATSAESPPGPISTDGPCADPTYELSGYTWAGDFGWFFQQSSTPERYNSNDVLAAIEAGFDNITSARNDCGLPDRVSASAVYTGAALGKPCSDFADGFNLVGFGEMPEDLDERTIAFTCPYQGVGENDVVEIDIVINPEISWAMSQDDCQHPEEMLEATITHEVGHVFGLAHVNERRHGDLTMSTSSNGPCHNEESSLGLGDVLGLEELYPLR
jgi:hypothetical protein